MNSAILIESSILDESFGILGAGGITGRVTLTFGIKDGNSGNCGGLGNMGTLGTVRFLVNPISRSNPSLYWKSKNIAISGGLGRSGIFGNVMLMGLKLKFGNVISIHKLIWERSMKMFGILKLGILRTGRFGQRKLRLHDCGA
ncbi:hypothetical protein KKG31_07805 [Patescibacteria group bacterium]|nr:hypothetical protein [Patescibacteria group bacterium]